MVSFFLALLLPAAAPVWLGSGGEVGASDWMTAVAMSHLLACRHPRDCSSGAREICDGGWIDGGLMADTLVLEVSRRPRNDPSGAMKRGRGGIVVRVSRCPRSGLSGAKEHGGWGWLRLWGVAGALSMCLSPMVTLRRPWN